MIYHVQIMRRVADLLTAMGVHVDCVYVRRESGVQMVITTRCQTVPSLADVVEDELVYGYRDMDPDLQAVVEENGVLDHVAETMTRHDAIGAMVLKYGLGFQLVEQRQDTTTTWAIEPYCGTCAHFHDRDILACCEHPNIENKDGSVLKRGAALAPTWCPRRNGI